MNGTASKAGLPRVGFIGCRLIIEEPPSHATPRQSRAGHRVTFRRPRSNRQDNMLGVWTNRDLAGTWSMAENAHRFQNGAAWPAFLSGRQLSLSLPFTPNNIAHRGEVVSNFFDNLLPDSDVMRRRLRDKFLTGSTETFGLLAAVASDGVDGVLLLPHGMAADRFGRIDAVPFDEAGVEQAIHTAITESRALGQLEPDDFRASIAGG